MQQATATEYARARRWLRPRRGATRAAALLAGTLLLAACASAPVPSEQLAVAEAAVDAASANHAAEHAPVAMKSAQDKLRAAEAAVAAGNNEEARRLAEQAEVDAQLADRTARTTRAQQAVAELRKGIRALQQESR